MADITLAAGDTSFLNITGPSQLGRKQKSDAEWGLYILAENLSKDTIVTDIGNVDYCRGESLLAEKSVPFVPISNVFCDNIILVKISSRSEYEEKDAETHPWRFSLKRDSSQKNVDFLKYRFGELIHPKQSDRFLVREQPGCFPLIRHTGRYGRAEAIREIISRHCNSNDTTIPEIYQDHFCTAYKIDLADSPIEIENLLDKLQEILADMRMYHFYLLDIDLTQDFIGVFDKEEISYYLTNNFNFCYRNYWRDDDSDCNVIEANEKDANCLLSWKCSNSRIKIYNKFVSQMTNPGVREKLGNHIVDFIHCPRPALKKTFSSSLAKQHGILRLEVTIYDYSYEGNEQKYHPFSNPLSLLERYVECLKNAPIYSVSIEKMWQKLTQKVHHNCCLVIGDILQFVYYGNGKTGQFTGVQLQLPDELDDRQKVIAYALSEFSFKSLPINYLEFDRQDDGVTMTNRECYIKCDQSTYFSRSRSLYTYVPTQPVDIHENELSTNYVTPRISTKKRFESSDRCCIEKIAFEFSDLTPTEYDDVEKSPKKAKSFHQAKPDFSDVFVDENWANLEPNCTYIISAVAFKKMEVHSRYHIFVGVLAEKRKAEQKEIKQVYQVKGLRKKDFIDLYNDPDVLFEDGYQVVRRNGLDVVFFESKDPLARFDTKDMISFEGYEFPKIENLLFYADEWQSDSSQDGGTIFGLSVRKLSSLFKKDNRKELSPMSEYVVYAFTVDTSSEYEQVAVLAQEKGDQDQSKQVYRFKGFLKGEFDRHYSNRSVDTPRLYKITTLGDFQVKYLASEEPLSEFKTNGTITTRNGCTFAAVEDLKFLDEMIFGQSVERIAHLFADWRNWSRLDTSGEYEVYSFTVQKLGTMSFVGVLGRKKDEKLRVYRFKGSFKKKFIELDDDRDSLAEKGFKVIRCDGVDIILLCNEQPIVNFTTNGIIGIDLDCSITKVNRFRLCKYER